MNRTKQLFETHGQAIWLDFLARGFIQDGDLKTLIEDDGVRGVTSNPAIFQKAIGDSAEYDEGLVAAAKESDKAAIELYEDIAVADIQAAADVLRPVYDESQHADGYVSLEVSPYLASETETTIEEARRLWKWVDRENLMIKVPGTPAGIPAVQTLLSEGINVNVTLLFARDVYEKVAHAYIEGLEAYDRAGGDLSKVASVASFFVSRIDIKADAYLDDVIAAASDDKKAELKALKGKVAIANAKLAYQIYKDLFEGERFAALKAKGAQVQRLLWASTGVKNPDYPDTLYVDELIGPETVNTMPMATLEAFRDHGKPRASLEENVEEARQTLDRFKAAGGSIDAIAEDLTIDGVKQFVGAFDKLLAAVEEKRQAKLGHEIA